MADMRLVVMGAQGRMGRALIAAITDQQGVCVAGAVEREGADCIGIDAGALAGQQPLNVEVTTDLGAALDAADGLIDFTAPLATLSFAKIAAQKGKAHIIGTTGFTPEQEAELKDIASSGSVMVKSGNMSLGVNLLGKLVEQAARSLDADFDIEVVEMHHKHKVDAPSGTALLLGESAAEGRGIDLHSNAVMSREGITGARERGSIGFATLRGGSVIGEHTVILAGEGERIELTHKAQDRTVFARGAVKAALWTKEKPVGYYTMMDVLGLN
ncbi:4-hydroxy-tetrahydrodipicolinate reductase [Cohaesibacter celericrescens]|uniref:4-hydroxy-tetrahydrodipicolinate reductase n=1 Tax=Cohaesibacter celericrescens TaxID=2067669 RepID=A0A2N5XNX8_9HYPH|nr:4-hydroxy-tetrahydrodipicolinate reductase [Cohaesibacter celericrescens]PLW76229.1 4-hydroxy-tetrahydrodipicolinate reductase [Cohaesibacter celericrescens]